jgi:hypothetical protein
VVVLVAHCLVRMRQLARKQQTYKAKGNRRLCDLGCSRGNFPGAISPQANLGSVR